MRLPFAASWEKIDDDQYFETYSGPFLGLGLGIAAVAFAVAFAVSVDS